MIPHGGPGGVTVLLADDPGEGLTEETPLPDRQGAKTVRATVLLQATVNPILGPIFGAYMPARVLSVDLDLALEDHLVPA